MFLRISKSPCSLVCNAKLEYIQGQVLFCICVLTQEKVKCCIDMVAFDDFSILVHRILGRKGTNYAREDVQVLLHYDEYLLASSFRSIRRGLSQGNTLSIEVMAIEPYSRERLVGQRKTLKEGRQRNSVTCLHELTWSVMGRNEKADQCDRSNGNEYRGKGIVKQ